MNDMLPVVDRRQFIGGSDVAAVLGVSPWRTPLALWEAKTAAEPEAEAPTTGVKRRGQRWESVVAEMLVEHLEDAGHSVEIVGANRRYIDPSLDFLAAEIDFEVRLDGEDEVTNVELKTVHPFKVHEWGEAGTDEAPVWYVAQAMHGLGVTGRNRALIAPLFGADEIRCYPVLRDEETIAAMRARCAQFWQLVATGFRPDPLTLSDLDRLYKGDAAAPALWADSELHRNWLRLRAIKAEIKAREREAEAIEFDVKRAMGDAVELRSERQIAATWKPHETSRFDLDRFKLDHPALAKQYTSKTTARPFIVK
jgi:putative phage-type endonuclease